jgi:hypothetical protein
LKRAEKLVLFAGGDEEFASQIISANKKRGNTRFVRRLRQYAKDNTWLHRGDEFEIILEKHPLVSVGTDRSKIVSEAQLLLDSKSAWASMARGVSPYGDGKAAARIAGLLGKHFENDRNTATNMSRKMA